MRKVKLSFYPTDHEDRTPTILPLDDEDRSEVKICADLIQNKKYQLRALLLESKHRRNSGNDFVDGRDFTNLENHLKNYNDWTSWRFKVQIELTGHSVGMEEESPCGILAEINILQVRTLFRKWTWRLFSKHQIFVSETDIRC